MYSKLSQPLASWTALLGIFSYSHSHPTGLCLQISVNERINITVQVALSIACLVICAMIFHNVIWMHRHRANLRPEIGLHMLTFEPGSLFFTPLQLSLVKSGLEQFQRYL